jgi:hypothetical protein
VCMYRWPTSVAAAGVAMPPASCAPLLRGMACAAGAA